MHAEDHVITNYVPSSAPTVLTHLWQSTIVGAIILLILAAGRGLDARTRRALAWIGLLKFLVPAAVFVPLLGRLHALAPGWPEPPVVPAAFSWRVFGADLGRLRPAGSASALGLLALTVWAAIAVGLFAFWLWRGVRLRHRILARAGPAPESVERQLMSAADRVGLWPIPQCLEVADDEGAGVMGALSSVVVVPRSLEQTLTPAEFKAILIHECIHEQRSDNLWSALQAALLCLFWFNPVVWLLSRRLSLETEKSCDEAVVKTTADPETYSRAIVKSVRHSLGLPQPGFAGAATTLGFSRLRNIGEAGRRGDRRWLGRGVLAMAAALALFSSYAGSLVAAVIVLPIRPLAQAALQGSANGLAKAMSGYRGPLGAVLVAPGWDEAYDPSELDRAPLRTREVRPTYPFELWQNRISGTVEVDFEVDADGTVSNPTAIGSSEREFQDAAVFAVSLWHFRPGLKDGMRVRTHLRVPIVFSRTEALDPPGALAAP